MTNSGAGTSQNLVEKQIASDGQEATLIGFHQLEETITKVIAQVGLHNTIELLEQFSGKEGLKIDQPAKVKLITTYIISQGVGVFDLEERYFLTSNIREYRESRMACYHLLRKYTDCSYATIGEKFDKHKRIVLYFCHRCNEMLSVPWCYSHFIDKYHKLERGAINFIAKINQLNYYERY